MHDSRFNDAESYSKSIFMEAAKIPFMRLYHFFMCSGQECVDYTRFLAGPRRPAYHAGWNVLDNEDIAARPTTPPAIPNSPPSSSSIRVKTTSSCPPGSSPRKTSLS